MATSFVLENNARDAMSDALYSLITTAGASAGVLEILETSTVLATFALPTAGSTSVNGVITFGTISNVAASAAGTANTAKFWTNAKGALVATADVGTTDATVILDNVSIANGQTVSISSCVITVPAGT